MDKASGSPYVLHTDAQGAVRVITDSAANVVETYYNDEYGNPLITLSAAAPNNVASQPLQYTAEPRDSETGLIYLRARMYDPSIGRLNARDMYSGGPSRPQSYNRYAYASSGPLNHADPSGQQDSAAACKGVVAIFVGARYVSGLGGIYCSVIGGLIDIAVDRFWLQRCALPLGDACIFGESDLGEMRNASGGIAAQDCHWTATPGPWSRTCPNEGLALNSQAAQVHYAGWVRGVLAYHIGAVGGAFPALSSWEHVDYSGGPPLPTFD
ncbi:MAG: hypothetical protein QOF51_1661 [Chloroflexota bacterium]|nr:hypothetical protein [Chloroflexota bacterium]